MDCGTQIFKITRETLKLDWSWGKQPVAKEKPQTGSGPSRVLANL